MSKKFKIISIIIIILLCIAYCNMSLSSSNDTFYLVKLGESISKNGIDMIDHFSWIPNLPYTYPHWLYSILLYFLYNSFGYVGIYISSVISFIIIGLLIYYVNLKMNKDEMLALIVSVICIFPLSLFMFPRSQSISIIFLFLEVFFINQLINSGKKIYSVLLIICSLIIANVHATIWIVFFIFFMPFFGEHIVYLLNKKLRKKITLNDKISINKINNIKLLTITFFICLLVGLLSPSRICYTYFIKIAMGDTQEFITEHFPMVIIRNPQIIIISVLMFFNKSKVKLSEFFMIIGITLMSFVSIRHLLFYNTIGILYFSIILKRNLDEKHDVTLKILQNKISKGWILPSILVIIVGVICAFKVNENINRGFISEKDYPVKVVQYIKENLDYKNIKIMNHYDFGSYLLFNDIKVFFDSRCDLYNKEFNGLNLDIFDDFFDIYSSDNKYDYDKVVEKYGAEYILLYDHDIIHYLLKNDIRYKEIYADDNFVLYQKIANT